MLARSEGSRELSSPPCSLGAFGASWISRHLIYSAAFLPREKHQLLIKRTHFCSSVIPVLPRSPQGRGAVNYLASPFSHRGGTVSVVGCHRANSAGSQLSPSTKPSPTKCPRCPPKARAGGDLQGTGQPPAAGLEGRHSPKPPAALLSLEVADKALGSPAGTLLPLSDCFGRGSPPPPPFPGFSGAGASSGLICFAHSKEFHLKR